MIKFEDRQNKYIFEKKYVIDTKEIYTINVKDAIYILNLINYFKYKEAVIYNRLRPLYAHQQIIIYNSKLNGFTFSAYDIYSQNYSLNDNSISDKSIIIVVNASHIKIVE